MKIQIPQKANYIIGVIQNAGFEAYVVGGCVRDAILGREPHDWDITTSAKPEEVKALFNRTIDTGIEHGTVTVMIDKEGFEVTTYRIDGEYEDSRHPKEVIFTPSLKEDLQRRDFTINAMAYNDTDGLVDIFGGMEDIKSGVIRCVGNAMERFTEDALRIMRAIRFSAQLGYVIEENTKKAITALAPNLKNISVERIQVELLKLITSPHPDYLRIAYETKVTAIVFPEFDAAMETEQNHPHHMYSVGEHILHSLTEIENQKYLRLAMLFHDIGKPSTITVDKDGITHFHGHAAESEKMANEILRRLRFDNDTIYMVRKLVLYHDYATGSRLDDKMVRRAINKIGEEVFPYLFPVMRADIMAQSEYKREEKLSNVDNLEKSYNEIMAKKQPVNLKMLAVTGNDLIENGMKPGKQIGETLERLLNIVIENPEENVKENLLKKAFMQ